MTIESEKNAPTARATLADAQPGGRVRLGDQAERARFEAWAKGNGIYAFNVGSIGNIPDMPKIAWLIWQAALSAQPSPGGQGDVQVSDEMVEAAVSAYVDTEGGIMQSMSKALEAALAARQPVGWQPMESAPKDGTVVLGLLEGSDIPQSIRFRDGWEIAWDGYRIPAHDGPLRWAPLYAAPPAQAVDLGQLQRYSKSYSEGIYLDGAGDWVRFADVLALIDSQTVGK